MGGPLVRVGLAVALATVLAGVGIGSAGAVDPPSADLSVSIGELRFADETFYEAAVTNNGPDTAVAVKIDETPLGDLAAGATVFFGVATLTDDMCGGYVIVSSSTADPDSTNNRATYGDLCVECQPVDPLVLEIPADFVVTEGDLVGVDATATGSDTQCENPLPPYWTQTTGAAVLPQDPYHAEDLSFTAPSGPTTLTFVLNYVGQTRTLTITVLDSPPTFDRFLSPLPTSPVRKSGGVISVKFLLTDSSGAPITSTAGVLTATLTPGTTSAPCAWSAIAGAFQCNLKPPKGLGADNPYTITVLHDGAPLPGATAPIAFKG